MVKKHISPWIYQLNRSRPVDSLLRDTTTNIAIVGGGIAGVSTAYFLLTRTNHHITLIEADKIAHGATGHNAGQIVSYFERSFADIVAEYGLESAAKGQSAIKGAWGLLDEIMQTAKLSLPFSSFAGYAGCISKDQVLLHLEDIRLQKKAGLEVEHVFISKTVAWANEIPLDYQGLYTFVSHNRIMELLETTDIRYIAALASRKGCMNSALFCEELILYLAYAYPGRFRLFEHTPVKEIVLSSTSAVLKTPHAKISAEAAVLCTNGFETISITNIEGKDINKSFHTMVKGAVGFMAGYLEQSTRKPLAISYFASEGTNQDDPYFYITRREYTQDKRLICIGGPEVYLRANEKYKPHKHYIKDAPIKSMAFLKKSFAPAKSGKISYKFQWHGLMAYTKNGIRCIGPDPRNRRLLYNLGCNGVGILPSIYGGKRISEFFTMAKPEKSLFDPKMD